MMEGVDPVSSENFRFTGRLPSPSSDLTSSSSFPLQFVEHSTQLMSVYMMFSVYTQILSVSSQIRR